MVDPAFFRPADVVSLVGDAGKAKRVLGWEAITPLETLCQIMVEADVKRVSEGRS
jgi:GDPmannose 4,6-dehydratase